MGKESQNKASQIFLTLAIIFIIISLITILLILIKVPYTTTETYYVKEPYESWEYYEVKEPYVSYEKINYRVLNHEHRNHFWIFGCDVWVTIQNIDNAGGYFSVDFDVETSKGVYKITSERHFLSSGNTHKFLVSFNGVYEESDYDVNYPLKKVTKIRTVTKKRSITKFRNVPRTRDVVKYCNAWKKIIGRC